MILDTYLLYPLYATDLPTAPTACFVNYLNGSPFSPSGLCWPPGMLPALQHPSPFTSAPRHTTASMPPNLHPSPACAASPGFPAVSAQGREVPPI